MTDPSKAIQTAPAMLGRVLCNKWRIERLLGTGGMSSVFAATHRNGKRVAIKVLHDELALNPRARRRFLREGYIANRMNPESAPSVLDDDVTDDGKVFLVMEQLEGQTLDELRAARGGSLPAPEVVWLAQRLLDVLIEAHGLGIVHRDVKPSNVFLTGDGRVKLLDFGIASLHELSGLTENTRTGAMLGTPAFMAPEQARGRWTEVDARTDIWAVGATLYQLLSGRLVHEEATANETLIATATRTPVSISVHCPGLPALLGTVIDRALRVSPGERWRSAHEMRNAIDKLQSELPPLAHPVLPRLSGLEETAPESAWAGAGRALAPPATPLAHRMSWDRAPDRTRPPDYSRAVLVSLVFFALVGTGVAAAYVLTSSKESSALATPPARPAAAPAATSARRPPSQPTPPVASAGSERTSLNSNAPATPGPSSRTSPARRTRQPEPASPKQTPDTPQPAAETAAPRASTPGGEYLLENRR